MRIPLIARTYGLSLAVCLLTAVLALPLQGHLDLANIVMLFLLAVLLIARFLGSGPAVLSAFVCVALFDFFFVPPHLSLSVHDAQYFVTFVVMLATALMTGTMTAGLRREAQAACTREHRAQALYGMARELAGAIAVEQVVATARGFLREAVGVEAVFLLPGPGEVLQPVPGGAALRAEIHLAHMALQQEQPVECTPMAGSGFALSYFALRAPVRSRGVMAVAPLAEGTLAVIHEQRALIEAVASLVAIALERLHYVEVAQQAEIFATSERLRASLFSALSHDLRTPLTALRGAAETLALTHSDSQRELAEAVRDQAVRLSRMVCNLLDMARFQAGKVALHKEWLALEEVLGSSLKLLESALAGREVRINLPSGMPLIEFDAVLIERVFCNLIENALKYSPDGTALEISAALGVSEVTVCVCDQGMGFTPGREQEVFALFSRGEAESAGSGFGLGLAICRAIVEAHGGRISAGNRPQGGAMVTFSLPSGSPPEVMEETDWPGEEME